jgi:hypothetical protein
VKFLSLMTYLGFVWALFVSLCLAPGESLGQTATQYSRVVAQAERIAYLAAQRSALANQVATAALAHLRPPRWPFAWWRVRSAGRRLE